MEELYIKTWDEFIEKVESFNKREKDAKGSSKSASELLYRGQPDSNMKLQTTLERIVRQSISLRKYHRFIYIIKAKIESVTERTWKIYTPDEFDEWCKEAEFPLRNLPGYSYLAYLRHHGLPSPLLDWTRSPYIAAHFAMAPPPSVNVKAVAIYIYQELSEGIKFTDISAAEIAPLGPFVATHRRHYLQQSVYTICTSGMGLSKSYASHEDVIAKNSKHQDFLWKIIIPITERRTFIEHLQRMNINPFSLFETEDRLMEDIYLSEMFLRNRL